MKKFRILIPALKKTPYEFNIMDLSFGNNTKGTLFLKYLHILGYGILLASFFLIPLTSFLFTNTDADTAVLKFLVYIIPISIAIFLSIALLNGNKKFIDPPFFLAILIFALGTTTSSVLVSNPSLNNTFGTNGIRALSGISIIAFITIYYLSSVYLHNRPLFRRAFRLLVLGSYVYILITFLQQYNLLLTLENITLTLATIGGIFVLSKSTDNLRWTKLILVSILIIISLYSYINGKLNLINLNFVLIPALAAVIVLLIAFYLSKRNFLQVIISDTKKDLDMLKKGKLALWELGRILTVWLIILSPLIIILFLIWINSNNPNSVNAISSLLKSNIDSFNSIVEVSKNNFGNFLFGSGASRLQLSNSLLGNVIITQGFIGLASYLFLATYSIMVSARYVYFNFKKGGNYIIPSFLLFMTILITVEGLFFYPGMKVIYIWWVSLALISVKYLLKSKKNFKKLTDQDFAIVDAKISSRNIHRYIRYALVLLLIIGAIYISHTFSLIIK